MSRGRRGAAATALVVAAFLAATGAAGAATRPLLVGFADDAGKYFDAAGRTAVPPVPVAPAPAPGDPAGSDAGASTTDPASTQTAATPPEAASVDASPPDLPDLTRAGFFAQLTATGATANRMTVLWDPARPLEIPHRALLDAAILEATTHRVDVILSVRGEKAGTLAASPARPKQFAPFLAALARAYPEVRTFVVGNEPNQPRFWQPQFAGRRRVAAAAYERVLAASYDALKRVDPKIQVVGAGISSRGNDDPDASSNRSTSPVRFVHDLGVAYRRSGRTRPIMDALGFHPYPRSSADPLGRPLDWPNVAWANLARLKQALWDAFGSTAQPTTETGLKILIDEVGWQAAVTGSSRGSYFGVESTPVTSEAGQATAYSQLIRRAACDPALAGVLLFPLVDEPDLERFQSGVLRADGTRRPSFAAVRAAIARTRAGCPGRRVSWRHRTALVGGKVFFEAAAGASSRRRVWGFRLAVGEEARYDARIVRIHDVTASRARVPLAAVSRGETVAAARGVAHAQRRPFVRFRSVLAPGLYVYAVELRAAMNRLRRQAFVSRAFRVA